MVTFVDINISAESAARETTVEDNQSRWPRTTIQLGSQSKLQNGMLLVHFNAWGILTGPFAA